MRAFLKTKFEASGGSMSFEDFMALALYDPEFGYYGANISDVGNGRGDFATTATLSAGLGKAVAFWIQAEAGNHEWNGRVSVIEVGPGSGDLAAGVLKEFGWWGRRKLDYHLVEVSPALRKRQRRRLRGQRVRWHDTVHEALRETEGRALIYSNELFDAFPAKWLRATGESNRWEEICVSYNEADGLREFWCPLPAAIDPADFTAMQLREMKAGRRIEIQPSVKGWINELGANWKAGSILSVDYGGDPGDVYGRNLMGTVRGYFKNERITEGRVYSRFGKQDLTVDVNFSDLENWGRDAGIETVRRETQREFLERYGIVSDPLIESGAADEFQVLLQRKAGE
ncbi:SAM-dependent methyltransferase [Verrucomicrobiales bacterium BCK34]|nr:SAM-dependent methyltransferase [Verrucomicrobiales bacterium BCK34]